MRCEISVFLLVYYVKVAINVIFAEETSLDRQLERMMKDEKQMREVIRTFKVSGSNSIPEISSVIGHMQWCSKEKNFKCIGSNIQMMVNFNHFLISNSEKYRNFDYDSPVARLLINCHWNFMLNCFEHRIRNPREELSSIESQWLADEMSDFWKITGSNRDRYYLSIASDILAERRKIRDALENPSDWAKMIESLLKKAHINNGQMSEEDALEKIQAMLRQSTIVESLTGLRYPTEGFIEELYERLILQRCKNLQDKRSLVNYLNEAATLATIAEWPENGKEQRFTFRRKFNEHELGPLTLGLLVCNELTGNEKLKELVSERGGAIVRFLTGNLLGSINNDEVPFGFQELHLVTSFEKLQSLTDIFQKAQEYCDKEAYKGMRWILNQMFKLRRVAEVEPSSFACKNEEIVDIEDLSLSLSKLFSNYDLHRMRRLMNDLRDSFAKECIQRSIRIGDSLADIRTILAAVRMPRFWNLIEQRQGFDERVSLRLWLGYAGSLYDGRTKIPDPRFRRRKWRHWVKQSIIDAVQSVPKYIPKDLEGYWDLADEARFISKYKEFGWASLIAVDSIYKKIILNWCRIFDHPPTPFLSAFIDEIKKAVKIASSILRPEYDFTPIEREISQEEFLFAQLALGYSTCLNLDWATRINGKISLDPSFVEEMSNKEKLRLRFNDP